MVDPAASKAQPLMDAKVRHEDPKKGLHDVRSFIGACNFYRRHIKRFTCASAILTDLIKKSTTWRWGSQEVQAFDDLKDKVANAKCLGVPRAQGEIILVTDASNVGRGGTLVQWQALEKEEFHSAISQWGTDGLNRDGTLRGFYSVFSTVFLMCLSCCLLLVSGSCCLFFDDDNVLLLKYKQFRITQARDKQVEDKQDQSMKGCSHKELDKERYQQ